MKKYHFMVFVFLFFAAAVLKPFTPDPDHLVNSMEKNPYQFITDFSKLKDTVYTLKHSFLEVNIKTQMGYIHFKDSVKEFGVSTGTKWVLDGVETKEGLFVIQSKMPQWHSRQFDSTLMLNWMGFNYGIGFHALLGNSYYRFLGVKKSSHGCVRLTREDAKFIYQNIELGTPVLVHSGNNAVTVSFADSLDPVIKLSTDSLLKDLPKRFKNLYDGVYFVETNSKLLIDYSNVGHTGLPIGNSSKIPKRQFLTPVYSYIDPFIPPTLTLMPIQNVFLVNNLQTVN